MADHSYYRIDDCDIERTPVDTRLFTIGDLRREMEFH